MTNNLITGEKFGEERDGPRAHLLAQAEKPFSALRTELEAVQGKLGAALEGVSAAQASFQPSGGEGEDAWGVMQIVRHLAGSEGRFARRVLNLARGDEMGAPTAPRDEEDTRSFDQLKAALALSDQEMLAAGAGVEGSEDLTRTWNHVMFGELNCRMLYALQALHTNDHARQIERLKAMPGFSSA